MIVPDTIFKNGTDVRKGTPAVLNRNNQPITGKYAFDQNRQRTLNLSKNPNADNPSKYPGYRAEGLLSNRQLLKVPRKNDPNNPTGLNGYFAMGDNRDNSSDSRFISRVGFIPRENLIGRAEVKFFSVDGAGWK